MQYYIRTRQPPSGGINTRLGSSIASSLVFETVTVVAFESREPIPDEVEETEGFLFKMGVSDDSE